MNGEVTFALLGSLGMFALLAVIYALFRPRRRPAPPFHTANARAMARQVRQLQRQVPDAPPRPHVRAGPARNVAPMPQGTLAQVRAQAITAALRDMGTSSSRPNPYRAGSATHTTWQEHYDRLTADHQRLQDEPGAGAETVQTPAPAHQTATAA